MISLEDHQKREVADTVNLLIWKDECDEKELRKAIFEQGWNYEQRDFAMRYYRKIKELI